MVDFNLANQSRTAFRSELNLILAALAANNYSATEPTTTFPGMEWVDSSGAAPVLKRRNAADDGWILLGTLDAAAGFTITETVELQLRPVGEIGRFAMQAPPTGWLECDGSAISRTTYSRLFTALGTTWGVGDGATTFNIPDARGRVGRGWDNGAGVDSGRAFGSYQAEEVKAHTHSDGTLAAASGGTHSHTMSDGRAPLTNWSGTGLGLLFGNNASFSADLASISSSGSAHSHDVTGATGSTGGAETRMINYTELICIRY